MIYYSVVEGDPLDSGGNSRVITGLKNCTITDDTGRPRRMAFIGHEAWCDRCHSAGEIVSAAGCPNSLRTFDIPTGRYQAVGGDKVICKCPSPPRIIPVYGRSWTLTDDRGGVSHLTNVVPATAPRMYDEQYILRDANTLRPLANIHYRIRTAAGRTFVGVTDAYGHTQRVITDGTETLKLEVKEANRNG